MMPCSNDWVLCSDESFSDLLYSSGGTNMSVLPTWYDLGPVARILTGRGT